MNYDHRDHKPCCEYHPTEVLVGVCPLCLNERLIILAAKQDGHRHLYRGKRIRNHSFSGDYQKPSLRKIFDFGSLFNRLEFRHRKSEYHSYTGDSTSHEDSFISIKFENNIGVGTWEKSGAGTVSKVSLENCNFPWNHSLVNNENKGSTKTVVEHAKSSGSSLRWQKRIGHLFQLSRWKRSNKGSVSCGKQAEGAKGRNNGWIRSLTKRRTKEY